MNLLTFYNSYPGMYITQSFFHSFITVLLVDAALQAWKIENPITRQSFRLTVIILPILSFPLYQAFNPERGSLSFRMDALFDSTRLLNLEIWRDITTGTLFLLLLSFTTIVFLIQEMIPIIKHALASRVTESYGEKPPEDSAVNRALAGISGPKPDVYIVQDDDLVLFVTTGKHPAIFLSTGTVEALTLEQLQTAIAHEIAHIARNKRPVLIAAFALRIIQFFSLVALIEFRRIVQEEEKICDDFAVTLTGKSQALAETLRKFHGPTDSDPAGEAGVTLPLKGRMEEFSHSQIIKSRITRLEANLILRRSKDRFAFVLTCAAILIINYSIV
jgi:Zn-dependent protease with chaperone function